MREKETDDLHAGVYWSAQNLTLDYVSTTRRLFVQPESQCIKLH